MFPSIIVVTPKKFLGANYGFMVAPPFATIRPERATVEPVEPDWGFNDTYVVPLYLRWHTPRADFVAVYGLFAPTGTYEADTSESAMPPVQFGTFAADESIRKIDEMLWISLHLRRTQESLVEHGAARHKYLGK